ncbi:UNVERIFIED_CONTAM: hypothetical protein Sradi_7218800 [Sesamum radiatum]|uniref:DUF4283 domain-containing protein n=1 Tax=Sesamum radiatum TaxID=300843 RepID=A0AAW2IQC7_SESRA
MEERVRQEFDFPDFYSLASRVLDGDEDALGKLLELKNRWERRFPDHPRARRIIPRFPSKLTFLPRRSIVPPVDNSADLGTPIIPQADVGEFPVQEVQETPMESQSCSQRENPPVSEPEVFIGNVKLKLDKSDDIAAAFLNSSRKTLRYIPPTTQNNEIVIKPTPSMVVLGSQRWHSTAVGYFLGRRPYFPQIEAFARTNWKGLQQVSATANGFFFFRFKTRVFMEEVIEEGPWLFQGQPVVLQPWEQGMSLRRQKHLQVPVWIRLRHLPMEYWTEEGLSAVASGIGTPLYTDKITKNCLRLDFARVCVMLDYHSQLPKHLVVLSPILAAGKEVPIKVDVEYEWLPLRCKQCCSLGHTAKTCPETTGVKQKAPVAVYVQKQSSEVGDSLRGKNDAVAATSGHVGTHVDKSPNQPNCVEEHVAPSSPRIAEIFLHPRTLFRRSLAIGGETGGGRHAASSCFGPSQSSPADPPP